MSDPASDLVRKLWQYCNVLRDDGLSYPDYVEQLTYLLFLKMSDEQPGGPVPIEHGWGSLIHLDTEQMHRHYGNVLSALGRHGGALSLIFRNAKNKIRDPAKLRLLIVDLIGQTEWSGLSTDLKGDAYEGLLEKNARDTKSGAGQYFTPRPLIEAIVRCVDPKPGEVICDPACGTGGFLLAAHDHILSRKPKPTVRQRQHLRTEALRGVELVEEVARLATMNLLLHGVAGQFQDQLPIECADSLKNPPAIEVDVVLTNPPFGVKGSVTYAGAARGGRTADELMVVRPDFWVQTANKQLNFLQHILALLKPGGRAAVIVPDNVLFEGGSAAAIRRRLLETCDVHTLLRLPPGLFYAAGVKANVVFFNKSKARSPGAIWVYDLRSSSRFSLKTKPLRAEDLLEFVGLYRPTDRRGRHVVAHAPRWRRFETAGILASRDARLDLAWVGAAPIEEESGLSRLEQLSSLIAEDLELALSHIRRVGHRGG